MDEKFDSIIIGGGPAGLSAAINLIQRGKKCLVLSAGSNLLRRAELVDNYLGMPRLTGGEMMDAFIAHARALGAEIREGMAGNVFLFNGEFMVNFGGEVVASKTIILASGVAKAKAVDGEERLLGRGVSYCATCDGMLYKGREVAVWGLSDDAAHEAAFLNNIGCKVTFISNRAPEKLAEGITFLKGSVRKIHGESVVEGVSVGDTVLPVTGVFILRASIAPAALISGIATNDGYVIINAKGETNIAGVYAAGDITGKPLQVSNAVGDGLVAALSAAEYLDKK